MAMFKKTSIEYHYDRTPQCTDLYYFKDERLHAYYRLGQSLVTVFFPALVALSCWLAALIVTCRKSAGKSVSCGPG
jgi:hypothetical protein